MNIVYVSNTGYTKKYAELLADKTDSNLYELKDAPKGEPSVFLGWIMASKIKGYSKAVKNLKLVAVCAVGMSSESNEYTQQIIDGSSITAPLFYLRGGLNIKKLGIVYKTMMKILISMAKKKPDKTADDEGLIKAAEQSIDLVDENSLIPVIALCTKEASL